MWSIKCSAMSLPRVPHALGATLAQACQLDVGQLTELTFAAARRGRQAGRQAMCATAERLVGRQPPALQRRRAERVAYLGRPSLLVCSAGPDGMAIHPSAIRATSSTCPGPARPIPAPSGSQAGRQAGGQPASRPAETAFLVLIAEWSGEPCLWPGAAPPRSPLQCPPRCAPGPRLPSQLAGPRAGRGAEPSPAAGLT